MRIIVRSIRNVLSKVGRLTLVVTLLGASLMFVAAMMSLSANSQQELAAVHERVGTTITIHYASNDANNASSGQQGNGNVMLSGPSEPIPNDIVTKVKHTQGVVDVQENLLRSDDGGELKGKPVTAPNGQQMNIPLSVAGIASDASTFTIMQDITPTLVAGRAFRDSDANANVAMMSQAVADVNQLHVGSTFSLKGTTFTLIGLYTTDNQIASNSIVLPMATMQRVFQVNGVDSIKATAANYEQVESVAARLRSTLGDAFNITTQTNQYRKVFDALHVAQQSIQVALVVSFVIAAIVIVFAVLTLVRERTAEIAILKTIGASPWQVVRQFWIEILFMSGVAAALAVLLLVIAGPVIANMFDIDPASMVDTTPSPGSGGLFLSTSVGDPGATLTTTTNPLSDVHLASAALNPQTLLIIVGVGMGLALLTTLIPTWSVSHIKPAVVLRRS